MQMIGTGDWLHVWGKRKGEAEDDFSSGAQVMQGMLVSFTKFSKEEGELWGEWDINFNRIILSDLITLYNIFQFMNSINISWWVNYDFDESIILKENILRDKSKHCFKIWYYFKMWKESKTKPEQNESQGCVCPRCWQAT